MDKQTELKLGNKVLLLSVIKGEVIGQQKWSETEVHSSGGGGHIGPQGGHVSAPTITSTSKTKQEFWIREDDGRETSIELTDSAFTAREGQKVWITWGANKKNISTSKYLFAYNSASDKHYDFIPNWISWLYSSKLLKKPFIYRLLTTWLSFFTGLFIGLVIFPLMAADRSAVSIIDAGNRVLESFSFPASLYQALSLLPKLISEHSFALILLILVGWLVSSILLKILGRIFYLRAWEKRQFNTIHQKVFSACNELGAESAPSISRAED